MPADNAVEGELSRIVILIPLFNDWESLCVLLPALDRALGSRHMSAEVTLVDDGGDSAVCEALRRQTYQYLGQVDLLRLRRNLGHQRAIDELARRGGRGVVFAARTKRMESWVFRVLYKLFCVLHLLLTGIRVRVGNFSAVSPSALRQIVIVSELWNHYAAAVFRSRIPYYSLPLPRGRRYAGRANMHFPDLVMHGLSAISVFGDLVGVRLLAAVF